MRTATRLVVRLALLALPTVLQAQGSLAVQGFGYPTGQLSTGSLGQGGANAELDPSSPINPATLSIPTRFSIYMQFEPEFRRTIGAGGTDVTRTMRFPGFSASGRFNKFTGGVSFSTLLDRTFENSFDDPQVLGGETVPSRLRVGSNGAINDTRFALSWLAHTKLQIGAALHAYTGENRMTLARSFPDSTRIGDYNATSTVTYGGRAYSLGAVLAPSKHLVIGASARLGGSMDLEVDSARASQSDAPARMGVTVQWDGIPGTTLSARFNRTRWTDLNGLGSAGVIAFDADEKALGADFLGPRLAGLPTAVRLGVRDRTLPFAAAGEQVRERALSGGLAIPLARGRAQLDLSVQRAARSAAGIDEKSWFLGVGLGIRP